MEQLKSYYLLCTVHLGGKKHIIQDARARDREIIFTKKEIPLYFRQINGAMIAREAVVGGSSGPGPIIVI